jgi:hypothetical protein
MEIDGSKSQSEKRISRERAATEIGMRERERERERESIEEEEREREYVCEIVNECDYGL